MKHCVFLIAAVLMLDSADGRAETAKVASGKTIYIKYGCYQCHGREGQGSSATGPRIGPAPIPFAAFIGYLRQPTGQMPPYSLKVLSDSEAADIYTFLESLPKPPARKSIPPRPEFCRDIKRAEPARFTPEFWLIETAAQTS